MLQNWSFGLTRNSPPLGLKWRSSVWFITTVVGAGITTDVFFYTLIIPVIPFRLEALGYKDPSSLTGYLLVAYAGSLVISTPFITWLSEHYNSRRMMLLIALLAFIGSQILFMFSPVYWALVVARVIQGISSTVVWTVGCALLTDTAPEERIGQQFGLALTGLSFGSALGPTVGGALYNSLGFRAPFIAGLCVLGFDLILRFLVIEKQDALKWGYDPSAVFLQAAKRKNSDEETVDEKQTAEVSTNIGNDDDIPNDSNAKDNDEINETLQFPSSTYSSGTKLPDGPGNSLRVVGIILNSKRTMAAAFTIFVYGFCIGMQEPTIPLRFQDVYGYTSLKVGLVLMGASIPTILSGSVAGMMCDKYGTGSIIGVCYVLLAPWFLIMAIRGPVALFIASIILFFFFCGTIPAPAMAELAGVANKDMKGVGFAHLYGVFNLAYGIGTSFGPIVGSQLYDHVHDGFTIMQGIATAFILVAMCVALVSVGDRPMVVQIKLWFAKPSTESDPAP